MRSMTSGMLTAIEASHVALAFFVQVDTTSGPVYAWTGVGSIVWNGQTWQGLGALLAITPIGELSAVRATAVTISLSGVSSVWRALVLESLQRYQAIKVWLGCVQSGAIVADPVLLRSAFLDTAGIAANDANTISINLTALGRASAFTRANERRFTDQDQRGEYPGDGGFGMVARIQNATVIWATQTV